MNKHLKTLKETALTLIVLITFLLDAGVLQPLNAPPPSPAPVVCPVAIPDPPCLRRV